MPDQTQNDGTVVDFSTKRKLKGASGGNAAFYQKRRSCCKLDAYLSIYIAFSRGGVEIPGVWTLRKMIAAVRRKLFSTSPEKKVLLINHHKVGSALIWKIFEPMCLRNGWTIENIHGIAEYAPAKVDVVQLMHGIVGQDFPTEEFRRVRFVRDPRDVIVSGFLYHQRCSEEWCTNVPSGYSTLEYPHVPWPIQHLGEPEKREWVDLLDGSSYKQNLLGMSQNEGLKFEMEGYAKITIGAMCSWEDGKDSLIVRIEDLATDFEKTVGEILRWVGLDELNVEKELDYARKHDISRMTKEEIRSDSHISSPDITKWRRYFDDEVLQNYNNLFGEAHTTLGYE
ncbi:MAG: hypothetical protein CMB67_01910 [Euryarchaeota archaeon]|nr:hypothetical protein [Euryarchaeota archaeon]